MGCISRMLTTPIQPNPELCILSVYPEECNLSSTERKLVDFSLLHARRAIALQWKNMASPTVTMWLKDLSSSLAMERLTYSIKRKMSEFHKIWDTFLDFLVDVV